MTFNLTKEEALKFQAEDLAKWKRILNPDAYADLEQWTTDKNDMENDSYRIRRGHDLDKYVIENLLCYYK